jgi:hypothetical protein
MVDDYRSQLNVVGWALCSVANLVVGIRSYCRYSLIHAFGPNDALMVLATVRICAEIVYMSLRTTDSWHHYDSSCLNRCSSRLWPAS